MKAAQDIVEDIVDLQAADEGTRDPEVKERLRRVTERRVRDNNGVAKSVAARMLGVSVNTLDKWIGRERVAVVLDERSGRTLVAIVPLARLLTEVRSLRAAGASVGVLAAAFTQLEREDPEYQRAFRELYGPGLGALAENRLKPLVLPDGFVPED